MKKTRNPFILLPLAAMTICGISLGIPKASSKETNALFTPSGTYTNYDADTYYDSVSDDLTGTDLLSKLRSINSSRRKKTMGYKTGGTSASDSDFIYTDYDTSDPSTLHTDKNGQVYGTVISSFYSYAPCTSFNKEHVWPNTHGGNKVENDVHMARPTIAAENTNRGHSYYVENMSTSTNGWDPYYAFHVNPGKTGDLGEQCINSRGEAARIIFYCMVASDQLILEAGHTDSSRTSNNKMGDLVDILKWNLEIDVTEREMNRNEGAEYLQGNRNPFIDHPEYACKIWGNTNSATKEICKAAPTKKLESLSYTGTPNKTEYKKGENFNSNGITVTAYFDDGSSSTVTSSVKWNALSVGDTSVTGSYTYNGVTEYVTVYGIIVTDSSSTNYGTLDNPLSVSEAKALIGKECSSSGTYTQQQIYCHAEAGTFITKYDESNRVKLYVHELEQSDPVVTLNSLNMTKDQYDVFEEGDEIIFHGYGYNNNGTHEFKYNGNYEVTLDKNLSKESIIPVASVRINCDETEYSVGESVQLSTTVMPKNATNKSLSFTSNNAAVATVNQNGYVSFVGEGSATITATANNGVSSNVTFYVTGSSSVVAVTSVEIDCDETEYSVGESVQLSTTVLPLNATDKTLRFTSDDESVATVNQSGYVSFVGEGSATITATANNGVYDYVTFVVKESKIPVEEVAIDECETNVVAGGHVQLSVSVSPIDATDKTLNYSTSNSSVATVDSNGYVSFKGEGSATITATANNGVYDYVTFVVEKSAIPVKFIEAFLPSEEYYVGDTAIIQYVINPSDASNKKVDFYSSDDSVVSIDEDGNISFKKSSNNEYVSIYVKSAENADIYGEVKVKVSNSSQFIPVTGISIENTKNNFEVGEEVQIISKITPSNATDKSLSYSSNDPAIATVDITSGLVSFLDGGSATITVTASSGEKDSIVFLVSQPTIHAKSIEASLSKQVCYVGESASVNYEVLPENAVNKEVFFESSDETVATIDHETGELNFLNAGVTTIRVVSAENESVYTELIANVVNRYVPVQSIVASIEEGPFYVGDQSEVTYVITPNNATDKSVRFSSSNPSVASIDNSGVVSFNGIGSATLTVELAKDEQMYDEVTVTVIEKPVAPVAVSSISLSKASDTLYVGGELTLTATVSPENATDKSVTWSSDNEQIATVSSDGVVTAVSKGTVKINAVSSDPRIHASCEITVFERVIPLEIVEIKITSYPTKSLYHLNEQVELDGLAVEANFLDGTSADITKKITIGEINTSTLGTKTIDVAYKFNETKTLHTSFKIEVVDEDVTAINIVKLPSKINYFAKEEFSSIGLKVDAVFGNNAYTKDVTSLVTIEYNFAKNNLVTIKFAGQSRSFSVHIEEGTITAEHKAADFTYVFDDKLDNVKKENVTLADWKVLEHYYNALDLDAQLALKNVVTKYGKGAVAAEDGLSEKLVKCISNYDEIYLLHKDAGFDDFMHRSPKAPEPTPEDSNTGIIIGIVVGIVLVITIVVVIIVVTGKKNRKNA